MYAWRLLSRCTVGERRLVSWWERGEAQGSWVVVEVGDGEQEMGLEERWLWRRVGKE